MKPKTKKEIKNFFIFFMIAVGLFLMIFGIYIFLAGFHNLDLSVNMLKISYDENLDFYEMRDQYTVTGSTIDYVNAYVFATKQLFIGFFMCLIGALLYGVNFGKLEERFKNVSS